MDKEYFGFVYIWFDRKHKKFCVGSHQGLLDDGYVTSTGHMNRAFEKRPEDFKRRILEFYYGNSRKELNLREEAWLNLIKPEELGVKYYNLKRVAGGGNLYEGMSKNRLERLKVTLANRQTNGINHYKYRPFSINGRVYHTISEFKQECGFNPTSRLKSKNIKYISYFYLDSPKDKNLCEEHSKRKREEAAIRLQKGIQNAKNKNLLYDQNRTKKAAKSRKERHPDIGDKISKSLLKRIVTPISVDGKVFRSLSEAARELKTNRSQIRIRVSSPKFPNYIRITENEYKNKC